MTMVMVITWSEWYTGDDKTDEQRQSQWWSAQLGGRSPSRRSMSMT